MSRWRDAALLLQRSPDVRALFPPGTLVSITGLQNAAHLNDTVAKVLEFKPDIGRYAVQLAEVNLTASVVGRGVEGHKEVAFQSCRRVPFSLSLPMFRPDPPIALRKLFKPDNLTGTAGRWWWDSSDETVMVPEPDGEDAPDAAVDMSSNSGPDDVVSEDTSSGDD